MSACGQLCASWRKFLCIGLHVNHVCTFDTVTGNLAVISRFHHFQINERYDFFSFFETLLYKITVSFTMVIKRSPGGQAAGGGTGGRSTSKSTCEVPAYA